MIRLIGAILLTLLVSACATIEAPSGGEKDVHAPQVESVSVQNGTTQFSGNSLSFTFNEYISLNNPQQNILISPPLNKTPNYLIKGKTLTIEWEDTLKDNTTYNFYFANAIKDNNEGNDTTFSWVISTGSFIDSLSLSASAIDAETGEPMANIWLLGYLNGDTETVFEERPDFIAQTNKSGLGTFRFLPNKNMRIYALQDNNGNLTYDPGSDKIGFLDDPIEIKSAEDMTLHVFSEEDTLVRILEKKYLHPGLIQFVFNKEIDISKFWGDSSAASFMNDTAQSVLLDASVVKGNITEDYYLNGEAQTATFYINKDLESSTFKPILKNGSTMSSDQTITISCPRSVDEFDVKLIELLQDSTQIEFKIIEDLSKPREFKISAGLKPGSKYTLNMKEGALKCFFKMSSDSASYAIQTRAADYYGKLKVDGFFDGRIVQLMKEGKVVREVSGLGESFLFNKLAPGKYSLRMIEDSDNNGKWSSGNLKKGLQPEKVYYYPEVIDLRSGWDQELVWDFK